MDAPLLATKLFIARPQLNLVQRPRLVGRLDEGLHRGCRLSLLSASAGSGKTTLLGAWATGGPCAAPKRVAWLSLDEEDSDPVRFWSCVVAALNTVAPMLGQSVLPMLQGPHTPTARSLLTPLLNDAAALREPLVLVLDDYHLITGEAVHEGVSFLLDRLPPPLHLVIATRADPPLPISRLRARGQLAELRSEDLRFTPREASEFLNDAMGLGLRPADIDALEVRTEGWIAGLSLAALSLRETVDAHAFIEAFSGSHHYILDYLVEEVVNRQPQTVRRFLLRTSILERMCAPLCDLLTEGRDARQTLERLLRDNLFIVPLDEERRWYRYHHLFVDLLRKRLGDAEPPRRVLELHRSASRWHEENGLIEQAVKHAQAARDPELAARIAEKAAGASLLDARLTTILRWTGALPPDVIRAHPRLQIYRAWALYMNGHLDAARQGLEDCRRALEGLPASPENDALRAESIPLLDAIEATARGFMLCAQNRIEEAIGACSSARDMALEGGHVFLAAQATEGLALAQYHQGRLRASARSCRQVIELAERSATQAPLSAAGYIELAGIHTEWNELDEVADLLDKAFALCSRMGATQTLNEACIARSRLRLAIGDAAGAREILDQALEAGRAEGEYSIANFRLALQRAHLNLRAGRTADVMRWVQEAKASFMSGQGGAQVSAVFMQSLHTMLARAHLALGEPEKALTALEPLLAPAEAAGAFLHVIENSALKALALRAMGKALEALASIEKSLALAEPEGFVRMFLNEGAPMAALLREAAARAIARGYTERLLRGFTPGAPDGPGTPGTPAPLSPKPRSAARPLMEPLSPRELDVLRLVVRGLSNQQIAEKLFVALNTVKRHTSSIYGKMGVKSRTQAVARARELGLPVLPTA